MKKNIFILLVLLPMNLFYAQSVPMPKIKVEAIYTGEKKAPIATTRSVPPHEIVKKVGFNFKIRLEILSPLSPQEIKSSYSIVCVLPDFKTDRILFNYGDIVPIDSNRFEYFFPLTIKKEGFVKIFLIKRGSYVVGKPPFFYENKSNVEIIYLSKVLK